MDIQEFAQLKLDQYAAGVITLDELAEDFVERGLYGACENGVFTGYDYDGQRWVDVETPRITGSFFIKPALEDVPYGWGDGT